MSHISVYRNVKNFYYLRYLFGHIMEFKLKLSWNQTVTAPGRSMWHAATSCKVKFAQSTYVFAHQLIQPGSWDDLELLSVCFPVFYPLSVAFQEVSLWNELLVKFWPPCWIFSFLAYSADWPVKMVLPRSPRPITALTNHLVSVHLTQLREDPEGRVWKTPIYFLSFPFHAVFKRF